ncbi:MAG: hypothetical protein ACOYJ6_15695 [Caulobacterales bacterium]|jgi:hypothetical protein
MSSWKDAAAHCRAITGVAAQSFKVEKRHWTTSSAEAACVTSAISQLGYGQALYRHKRREHYCQHKGRLVLNSKMGAPSQFGFRSIRTLSRTMSSADGSILVIQQFAG